MFGRPKKPSYKDLDNLCNQQKETLKKQRIEIRNLKKIIYEQEEDNYKEIARQSERSYVVIRGNNKIIASTSGFLKRFKFDDGIIGSNCYKLLNNSSDEFKQEDFEDVFNEHPEEIEKTTIIIDGKGNERYVHINKKNPKKRLDQFYTIVEISEIGKIEKLYGTSKRILGLNGEAKTLAGYIAREKIKEIKEEAETEKNKIISKEEKKKIRKKK